MTRRVSFLEHAMADECKVFEMQAPRVDDTSIRVVPFLAKQVLSSAEMSLAFNKSTQMISVTSSLAGVLSFTTAAGVDPDGATNTFPIVADQYYDFDVRPGTKVRFD